MDCLYGDNQSCRLAKNLFNSILNRLLLLGDGMIISLHTAAATNRKGATVEMDNIMVGVSSRTERIT
jgi:hypothetical protein